MQIADFYQDAKARYGLRLIAGGAGVTREFNWVHLVEDIGNAGFLRGGELVITTGLASLQQDWLRDFLLALMRHQAAALILNTGKYIFEREIPAEVLALCEAQDFPLFVMPWQTHISDIMQEACAALMAAAQENARREQLLAALLQRPQAQMREEWRHATMLASGAVIYLTSAQLRALRELEQQGGLPLPYTLTIFTLEPDAPALQSRAERERLLASWRRLLNADGAPYELFEQEGRLLLLRAAGAAPLPKTMLQPPVIAVGESRAHDALAALPLAQREADGALLFGRAGHTESHSPLWRFDELGIYQLLLSHGDTALLRAFAAAHLEPLYAYDAAHHTALAETLRAYLLTGGSPAKTAARTFTHRNTIGYRLQKIKELTGCELQTEEERLPFLLAYAIIALYGRSNQTAPKHTDA